jgi:hypothetical protein
MARSGRKGGGMIGSKVTIPDDHAFATPGEIAGREHEAHQESPTTFSQIGPADNAGMNVATMDQNPGNRSGRFKWSEGV